MGGEPRFIPVTIYGVDERNLESALLDASDEKRYSATQLIVCNSMGDKPKATAGTLAGDLRHGIGVAHPFYDEVALKTIPPGECRFKVHDRKGALLEEIAIVRYKSRWQDDRLFGNGNQDLMMFEIASEPKHVDRFIPVSTYRARDNGEILLIAFGHDLKPAFSKRKARGRLYSNIGTRFEGDANLFITDVDSAPMASGGPLFDIEGVFVGLIVGSTSSGTGAPGEFRRLTEFNYGIRLDERFVREYAEFVKGR